MNEGYASSVSALQFGSRLRVGFILEPQTTANL